MAIPSKQPCQWRSSQPRPCMACLPSKNNQKDLPKKAFQKLESSPKSNQILLSMPYFMCRVACYPGSEKTEAMKPRNWEVIRGHCGDRQEVVTDNLTCGREKAKEPYKPTQYFHYNDFEHQRKFKAASSTPSA